MTRDECKVGARVIWRKPVLDDGRWTRVTIRCVVQKVGAGGARVRYRHGGEWRDRHARFDDLFPAAEVAA